MWVYALLGVFVVLGLSPLPMRGKRQTAALAIFLVLAYESISGHLL
jgi:hypothetical protein